MVKGAETLSLCLPTSVPVDRLVGIRECGREEAVGRVFGVAARASAKTSWISG